MATRIKKTAETEPVSLVQTKRTVADLTGDVSDAKSKIARLKCSVCGKEKSVRTSFYQFTQTDCSVINGKVCKDCLQHMMADSEGDFTQLGVYKVCHALDKPFLLWAYKKATAQPHPLDEYMKIIGHPTHGGETFRDSDTVPDGAPYRPEDGADDGATVAALTRKNELTAAEIAECQDLFGYGMRTEEYQWAWKLYKDMLNNYPLKTNMHRQKLADWAKTQMKSDFALAKDDVSAAEKWAKLAEAKATAAKINPSQLSAADLSDGISSFSKIAEAVEKAQDIIPILPKYREKPQDKVDYTIWQYVNYERKLHGLPAVEYADIYAFLNEQYEKQKEMLSWLKKEKDGHYDNQQED